MWVVPRGLGVLALGAAIAATPAASACAQDRAPAGWAERNRLTTGDPQGAPHPVDPRDARATADARPGQEQFWTAVVAGVLIASALAVGAGTWYFEMRRRARRGARDDAAYPSRQRRAS
jgi:hypothetical protein